MLVDLEQKRNTTNGHKLRIGTDPEGEYSTIPITKPVPYLDSNAREHAARVLVLCLHRALLSIFAEVLEIYGIFSRPAKRNTLAKKHMYLT